MDMSSQTYTPHRPPPLSPGPQSNNFSSNVAQLPPTGSPPTNVIVPPLYLDNLAREFGLGDHERMRLRVFTQIAGGVGPSVAAQVGQLYTLAVVLSDAAERRRQAQENTGVFNCAKVSRPDSEESDDDDFESEMATIRARRAARLSGTSSDDDA
ncbi:hypothetical protein B0H13DRAFT_2305441 [Mycena leptocephala]|nr:hypothetical protein B0H13DRAFT_2305441 [Mycena leptocephala]